jgi:hypothetical protein
MLNNEAQWIASQLVRLADAALFPLVNLGSSTARFREIDQPFIDRLVFAPLRARGDAIHHVDVKAAPGVDLAVDFDEDSAWEQIGALQPRTVLCSNVFEHVVDRALLARRLTALLQPGAHLVVTVPRTFPYHPDPIDTGFRPDVPELSALFPGLHLETGEVVNAGRLWQLLVGQELRLARKAASALVQHARRRIGAKPMDAPAASPLAWVRHCFVPFRVTCASFVR